MTQKHTKDHWPKSIKGGRNIHMTEIDYDRARVCVDACQGLTNEQLESGYIQRLIQEREEAVMIIKEINEKLEKWLK